MATITKKDLIDQIVAATGHKRIVVKVILQEFLDRVVAELGEGNRLEFRDFGVFEVKSRAPRKAHNPKTFEPVFVPGKRTVRFKIGRMMRETVEEGPTNNKHPSDTPSPQQAGRSDG